MPPKVNFTQQMIDDIGEMSYTEFSEKWNISLPTITKRINELGLNTLTGPNGLINHRIFDGVECKRCGTCLNWFPATKEYFYNCKTKPDGFMASCKTCQDKKFHRSESKISTWWTDEMTNDLSRMGDNDFCNKWEISRRLVIRHRKLLGIKSFINQYGTIEHKVIDGIEYKWCSSDHWDILDNFGKLQRNHDGLKHSCKFHEREKTHTVEFRDGRNQYHKIWRQTPSGKASSRVTWRIQSSKKRKAYVFWSPEDEAYILTQFNFACAYCSQPDGDTPETGLEFDHFIPVSAGGETKPGNLLPSCITCNRGANGKFTREPLDWLLDKFGVTEGYKKYNYIKQILFDHWEHWQSTR